jgi:hypothetical protein
MNRREALASAKWYFREGNEYLCWAYLFAWAYGYRGKVV